jgi:dTMP kinase
VTTAGAPGGHGEPGILLVLEGIDRSGRSTHARLLEAHFRHAGRGVARTSLTSSLIASDAIRRARRDGRSEPTAMTLLSAADLAERVEQVIVPALRAGLVVIADRYRWTPMARAEARGVDAGWLEDLFAFVPPPDAVLFLEVDAQTSLTRRDVDPDPYEAGVDLGLSPDLRESYRLFQERLATCFDRYATDEGFIRIAAAGTSDDVGPSVIRAADEVLKARAAAR